jgi:glycosyltransferase involved in cell wall biosynthesis
MASVPMSLAGSGRLLRECIGAGYVIVMEIDDHPMRRWEYEAGGYLSFRGVHALQTPSELLAEVLRPHNPNLAVLPNQVAALPPPRHYGNEPSIFFGALHRQPDWAPIMPALNLVLASRPQVRVEVVHDQSFFQALTTGNKNFTPTCPYEAYLARLGQSDIALLPLLDGPVNRSKSDVKFIESAAAGAAALANPTVYDRTIRHGETGLIYRDERQFAEFLATLLDHAEERRRLAAQAYAYVRTERLLAQHVGRQAGWYRFLTRDRAKLTAEIRSRVPDLFSAPSA